MQMSPLKFEIKLWFWKINSPDVSIILFSNKSGGMYAGQGCASVG